MRTIIKYTSVDGLLRYEDWNRPNRPEYVLKRIGLIPMRGVVCGEEALAANARVSTCQRTYEICDRYIDPATGNEVYEYWERL